MQSFSNFESFKEFVEKDINKADYNPVRFINIDTMPTWIKVKAYLQTKVECTYKLSEYCENSDIAPNLNRLKKDTRHSDVSALIIPLSEYLRINAPIADKMVYDLLHANYEKIQNGKKRIYIPLYRMGAILQNLDLSPKEQNCVMDIPEAEESDYALTIVQRSLEFKSIGNDIEGFRKYFIYWEQNPDKPIILHTEMAVNYEDIVFSDNVEVIVNEYDLLRHHGLPSKITQEMGTNSDWEYLTNFFIGNVSLDSKFAQILRVTKYSDDLFRTWKNYNSNEKWVLWLWARLHTKSTYLTYVFMHNTNIELFEKDIATNICKYLSSTMFNELYRQRKDFIIAMDIKQSQDDIQSNYANIKDIDYIRCMTDYTKEERLSILHKVQKIGVFDNLEFVYPILDSYLKKTTMDDGYLEKYFDLYKKAKIKNSASRELLDMVKENATEGCLHVWQLNSRNNLVNKLYDENSIVFFVDAFGVEYVTAFQSCFNDKDFTVVTYYGHCNLPAITGVNSDFYMDKNHMEPYYDLDHWKHSKCNFPESIEMELQYVCEIANLVKKQLSIGRFHKVILAADHGTSRFAFMNKGESHQVSESAIIFKYGRYCTDRIHSYDGISGCIQQDENWIFANYDKFVQKGAPICEIHGGASIEEMVVPVLTISKSTSEKNNVNIEIIVLTPNIKLPLSGEITIEFTVSIQSKNLAVSVAGKQYECTNTDGKFTFTQVIKDKRSEYIGKVISEGKIIGEIKYKVERPVQNNSRFDL